MERKINNLLIALAETESIYRDEISLFKNFLSANISQETSPEHRCMDVYKLKLIYPVVMDLLNREELSLDLDDANYVRLIGKNEDSDKKLKEFFEN